MSFRDEGLFDRSVPFVAGLGSITLAFAGARSPSGRVGVVPLGTGLAGWCPAHPRYGVRSCRGG